MQKILVVANSSLEVVKPTFVLEEHELALDAGFTEEDLRMLHALDNMDLYSPEATSEHWAHIQNAQRHLVA